MMRFASPVPTRTTIFLALFVAGLLGVTCFNGVESHSAGTPTQRAGTAAARTRAYAPVLASVALAGPVIDVDRTDDDASQTACTAAPNDCTLRGAIIFANTNAGTTINLPAGTYQLTIAGSGEQFAATGDLDIRANGTSIVGAGAASTIIQQTINDRVIEVNPTLLAGFTFSLSGVTIKGGNPTTGSGGGILSGSNGAVTTISDCIFDTNKTIGAVAANGGAISDTSTLGDTLTITNCTFRNNSTARGIGGGIRFSSPGTLTVTGTLFDNNNALTNSGGAINATGNNNSTFNISQSAFTNNQANGGASRGGAILVGNGTLNVSYSRFFGNTSGAGVGQAVSQAIGAIGSSTANDNWWGQNGGPGASDTFGTTASRWLQLRISAAPTTVPAGGSSTLTADIYGSSAGGTVTAANLAGLPPFPDPAATVFNNPAPTFGTISGAVTQFVNGQATATYNAGNTGGVDDVTATADNQTVTTNVTVEAPPTITCPTDITVNADPNSCTASVSFSATATGFPAPTVTYQIGVQVITSPHTFPAGTTTVTATASNGVSPDASCTFNVTVNASETPTVVAPPNVSATTGAGATSCSALVSDATLGTATAADTCSGHVTIVRTGVPAGNIFPVGTTTITYTGTDPAGHTGTATQTVTVTDNTPPTVTAPAPTTVSADASCQAAIPNVIPGVTASDNCTPAGSLSITQSPAAGTLVGLGAHTITITVTDANSNSSTATTTFTVNDTTPPTISAPADATYSCASQVPAANPAQASAADNCSTPTVAVSETNNGGAGSPASPLVITRVFTATDGAGNTASATQTITVVDNTPPTVTAPAPTSTSADASCMAAVPNVVAGSSASDNCGGSVTLTQSPAAGTLVGTGAHTITVTATDAAGNSATATTTFTVNDTTPPTISAPANATYSCPSEVPAASPAQATASDNCGTPTVTVSESNNGGAGSSASPLVITRVYTATDGSGNTASATQTITVVDNTPPTVTAPAPSSASADASCLAPIPNVIPGSTASDNCGGAVMLTQSPAAGTLVGLGPHTITVTATDAVGNHSSATTTFTVNDTTPPTLNAPPNVSVSTPANANSCTVFVSDATLGTASAADNCTSNVTITRTGVPAGNIFPVGITTITYTATDAAGNTTTRMQTVTVNDGTPPVINLNGQTISLWPPNHTYHTINVTDLVASVTDSCNTSLGVGNVVIEKVTSDEAENAPSSGNTLNDIVIAANCKSVQLRAEREGVGDGRVYNITFKVTDASGNVARATAQVVVQHNPGETPVDSGVHYTVNGNCP